MFQFLKVELNKIAFFVQLMVVIPHFLAVAAWRNNRLSAYILDRHDKGVGVVLKINLKSECSRVGTITQEEIKMTEATDPLKTSETEGLPHAVNGEIAVVRYNGNQEQATALFQAAAPKMAIKGYYPESQTWTPGSYGCGSFILALLLCFILIGVLVFIFMLIVPPAGTLTVTYRRRKSSDSAESTPVDEKTCPRCAEQVKAAAKICRFCNHDFTVPEVQ